MYWAPRVLCIAFAIFVSLFALDVFSEGYGFWQTIVALLIHLVPTAIIVIGLLISWRWEWVGAVMFIGLGTYYTLGEWKHPNWVLTIAGPLFLIGALFLFDWVKRKELRVSRS